MKTREQIYSHEATSLLRDITTYHCAKEEQLMRLYPGREEKIRTLLAHLVKQGRIFRSPLRNTYHDTPSMTYDSDTVSALWVLADFADKLEFHSTDTFPTNIIFFAAGETYEIIYIPRKKEGLILHLLSHRHEGDTDGKLILIVEDVGQIEDIDLPEAVYCTVNADKGEVQYYKKE